MAKRKSTSKPASKGESPKTATPATREDAQLQALRELSWLYYQARLWGSPRRFESTDVQDIRDLFREFEHEHRAALDKIEKAKKNLLATGYDAPDSWLTVRTLGNLHWKNTAATDDKPEMAVLTVPGADLPALDAVLREIYVAGMRLEAKAGRQGDWPQGQATKDVLPVLGEWSKPMSKASMMTTLHIDSEKTFSTFANHQGIVEAGNRQTWRLKLDGLTDEQKNKLR